MQIFFNMANMTIKNCIISRKDSQVNVTNINVDIYCDNVYSICPGVVSYVGRYDYFYVVVVQYTTNVCFQYKHLKSTDIKVGQHIDRLTLLGEADKYVQFAYLTSAENVYPCRIGNRTYYKQKPLDILLNGYDSDYIYGDGIGHPWDDDDTSRAPDPYFTHNSGVGDPDV